MSIPRFSIVIPTRNRHNTLKYALLTCLNQKNFDDYEIIVCDNCSSPETRETVGFFESEKIKYIRSDRPLAMSHNWELAVSHAEGEYVLVIGDDDGLFLNALDKIDRLVKMLKVKALRWEWVYYNWPDLTVDKNKLTIPIVRKNRILKSSHIIPEVVNNRMDVFQVMPMIYRSAIHRDLMDLLLRKTGRLFAAAAPDIYSGYAFAYLTKTYASLGIPLGVSGRSAFSTGLAQFYYKDHTNAQEFDLLNAEAHLKCHPQIPDIPVTSAVVADSFQRAKDNLFSNEKKFCINRKRLVLNCMTELRARYISGVDSEEDWRKNLAKIRTSLADDDNLAKWFDKNFADSRVDDVVIGWFDYLRRFDRKYLGHLSQDYRYSKGFKKGYNGKDLVLDASYFGLKNVFDVAEFCEKFYDPDIDGLKWHDQGSKPELLALIKEMRIIVGNKLSSWQ